MSLSTTLSKLSRITLLSIFCTGLFVSMGDVRVGSEGVVIGGVGVESVMAAGGPETEGKKDIVSSVVNGLADLSNIVIKLLSIFLTPLIMLSGWLLSPDWTFGDIFGLRPIIHKLWILVSNVVYVIFGFLLVGIAFANIFGAGGDTYKMSKMLPKLVTGMLIVPFTWFIVSAVLSVANVLTASVIQLPVSTINMAGGDEMKKFFDQNKIIPKEIILDLTASGGSNKQSKCPENCLTISQVLSDANG